MAALNGLSPFFGAAVEPSPDRQMGFLPSLYTVFTHLPS